MCGQRNYRLMMPQSAWRQLEAPPAPELVERVREEMERLAAEAPLCPAPGGSIRTRHVAGGYIVTVALNYQECLVTLVEVASTR